MIGKGNSLIEQAVNFAAIANQMELYKNLSGKSGVIAYEIRSDEIVLKFTSGTCYLYREEKIGASNFMKIKILALNGQGLTTFINQYLHNRFEKKFEC
jgi:hypothetical protein